MTGPAQALSGEPYNGPVMETGRSRGPTRRSRLGDVKAGAHVTVRPAPVKIDLLTDPWSVWCWGFEPVRRAIQLRYPTIEFRNVLGGMFAEMPDPKEMGFDVERFFAVVARTSGMPIKYDATRRDRPASTYPACVNVHAVRILAPKKEDLYLRALREAVYLDGLNISRPEVGAAVAKKIGLDPDAFTDVLKSGDAQEAFVTKIEELQSQGLHAYPTLIVRWGDRAAKVEGFQSLPAVLGVAQSVSGRVHVPLPDPKMADILPRGERVATREVAEVLGVSVERAYELLREAKARPEEHPGGVVWTRA